VYMEIVVPKGRYVVAVSGGVDSVVLLDLLTKTNNQLTVAHFNHGIRQDSAKEEALVKQLAKRYGLEIKIGNGKLGLEASEETARKARYDFLESVRQKHQADAIITAHHQDDLIETALINLLRGTGPHGLIAIAKNPNILRPLLNCNGKKTQPTKARTT
jgi:tRNA(Ile)-lysidine synthase